jgi:16S rRNA (guanine527-N7)-methyltransferase
LAPNRHGRARIVSLSASQGDLSKLLQRRLGNLLDSSVKLHQVEVFVRLLVRWNARVNLVGARTIDELIERHLAESLAALALLPLGSLALADVGSGAGLPGIPLKIARPGMRLYLVERQQKKAVFLRQAAREIGLQNVHVVEETWETWCRSDSAPQLDGVVSRAALDPELLISAALPLLGPGGLILLFLGREKAEALEKYRGEATQPGVAALRWMGASLLPGSRGRFLVHLQRP